MTRQVAAEIAKQTSNGSTWKFPRKRDRLLCTLSFGFSGAGLMRMRERFECKYISVRCPRRFEACLGSTNKRAVTGQLNHRAGRLSDVHASVSTPRCTICSHRFTNDPLHGTVFTWKQDFASSLHVQADIFRKWITNRNVNVSRKEQWRATFEFQWNETLITRIPCLRLVCFFLNIYWFNERKGVSILNLYERNLTNILTFRTR